MNIYRTPFGTLGLNVLNLFLVEPWGSLKPAQKRNPDGKVFRALFWGLWVRVMSPETRKTMPDNVNSPYTVCRADGWPLCPRCQEDELYSLLMWNGQGERPPIQAWIDAGTKCYRCGWEGKPDIRNITWKDDPAGSIWQGELWKDGRRVGMIGNYYDLDENGQRDNNAPAWAQPPKE